MGSKYTNAVNLGIQSFAALAGMGVLGKPTLPCGLPGGRPLGSNLGGGPNRGGIQGGLKTDVHHLNSARAVRVPTSVAIVSMAV